MLELGLILLLVTMHTGDLMDASRGFYQNNAVGAARYGSRWTSIVGVLCFAPGAHEVVPPNGPAAHLTSNTGGTASFAPRCSMRHDDL